MVGFLENWQVSVWVCVPSARPVPEVAEWAAKWKAQGYKVALWRDGLVEVELQKLTGQEVGIVWGGHKPYPGYAKAANELIAWMLKNDLSCDWVVAAGDDTDPDPNHTADEIAAQCSEHFYKLGPDPCGWGHKLRHTTFGVMQPTADRWGEDAHSRAMWPNAPAYIDRIAGSPWIGREFARRINQGRGPLWPEYHHNWADQELQEVATKLGVFWQRRDLIHFHNHCMREPGGTWAPHLKDASADYTRMKPVFEARRKMGFPGSEPIV